MNVKLNMEILNRIFDKLDQIDDKLQSLDRTQAKQCVVLEDHTRRSLANEKALDTLKEELKPVFFQSKLFSVGWKLLAGILGSGMLFELVKYLLERK